LGAAAGSPTRSREKAARTIPLSKKKPVRPARHPTQPGRLEANAMRPADRTDGPIASEILMAWSFRSETIDPHTHDYEMPTAKFAKISIPMP
jgi:hypothetical protein